MKWTTTERKVVAHFTPAFSPPAERQGSGYETSLVQGF
jgi:hypothetical protein